MGHEYETIRDFTLVVFPADGGWGLEIRNKQGETIHYNPCQFDPDVCGWTNEDDDGDLLIEPVAWTEDEWAEWFDMDGADLCMDSMPLDYPGNLQHISERDAHERFTSDILPLVRKDYEQDSIADYPARRSAFCDWVDGLVKDGEITPYQGERWGHPPCNSAPWDRD